ncbi:MAG: DUF2267 domain-containing protein [Methylorubrum rhodinum]|uniref:DUF2267 domain-containing protein n=1 Tax=Methylorubrum rhodinum TaxID=29428 RepID=UPI003BAE59FB
MTVPQEYLQASRDFDRFLLAARDALGHETTNQTFATLHGVFVVFRRRLSAREGLTFASALPPVLRAIFVDNWNPDEPVRPFAEREALADEVRGVRIDHNFSPDDAIAALARVLWDHADRDALRRAFSAMPAAAGAFWRDDA